MTRRWPEGVRRWCALVAFVGLAGIVAAQDETDAGRPRSGILDALEGVNLSQPAQAAFQSWPPAALVRRPYWLPWTALTFQRAAVFDRPVLLVLSVPWSRPAQRTVSEVLIDPDVLETINSGYIAVTVDADRRPDIAERYRTGNWPVLALLTPHGYPMLSKANEEQVARPIVIGPVNVEAMQFLLGEGIVYHEKWGAFLARKGAEWATFEAHTAPSEGPIQESASDTLARWLSGSADREHGGFGMAPKFVLPGLVEYAALRAARQVPALLAHAEFTLDRLIDSPLYDRRDGGVHRIAVLPEVAGVQYEKLLDRNAALLRELVFAQRIDRSGARAAAIEGTASFLLQTLARPGGGFYRAQIADPDSEDGGGYWTGEHDKPPPVDRVVLSGPNLLAAAALARAAHEVEREEWLAPARAAAELVLARAFESGRGVRDVVEPFPEEFRFLESQADAAFGLLDLYESTGDRRYLEAGRSIADFAVRNLGAEAEPALRDRLADVTPIGLLANPRWPVVANATLARALLRLKYHGFGSEYRDRAVRILGAVTHGLDGLGVQGIAAGVALEEALREPIVVRILGPAADPRTAALRHAAIRSAYPWTVVVSGSEQAEPGAVVGGRDEEIRVSDAAQLGAAIVRLAGELPGR